MLIRSFELMLRSSYCNAVGALATVCELNGYAFYSAEVPPELGGQNMLHFDQVTLQRMFDLGARLGRSGRLWSTRAAAARTAK